MKVCYFFLAQAERQLDQTGGCGSAGAERTQVNTFHNVTDRCAGEVSSLADAALRMYAKASALTLPCDGDAERFCGSLAQVP